MDIKDWFLIKTLLVSWNSIIKKLKDLIKNEDMNLTIFLQRYEFRGEN